MGKDMNDEARLVRGGERSSHLSGIWHALISADQANKELPDGKTVMKWCTGVLTKQNVGQMKLTAKKPPRTVFGDQQSAAKNHHKVNYGQLFVRVTLKNPNEDNKAWL